MAWVTTTTKNKRKRKKDKEGRNKGNTKKVKGKKKDKMKTKRLACINTSTYKMASDYIYKEEKKKNEDGASVRGKKKSSHLHLEGINTYTLRKNLVLNCFFLSPAQI